MAPEWGNAEELLALLVEMVDVGNLMYFRSHSKDRPWTPVQIPRPGQEPAMRKQATSEELVLFFGAGAVQYTPGGSGG